MLRRTGARCNVLMAYVTESLIILSHHKNFHHLDKNFVHCTVDFLRRTHTLIPSDTLYCSPFLGVSSLKLGRGDAAFFLGRLGEVGAYSAARAMPSECISVRRRITPDSFSRISSNSGSGSMRA